ncbi:ATG16 domain protein [Rhizoctonia solani AG-3 Rhs1AP]|uniref:ATG16 domain protein n=1 Tax=Rhizoctonia solani AG-3 Rhs1AP TaxID=1086054 RepID=X8JV47_9AGAM|nr:ATG16 domain protein [Rhizoctonia solani AG-3 Rhs1AP]
MCLQAQEIPRLSFYLTAYHELLERYKELEKIHALKLHECKQANEVITVLKAKLVSFQKIHVPNIAASSSSPVSHPQQLANTSGVSSNTGVKSPAIDWQSEGGKQVSAYLIKQRDTLATYQKECESLKSRVMELTTQLEAKDRPDAETVTAIEKAELMEAELEGLHGRLAKCEDDLEKAQTELNAANLRNQQLSKETAELRKEGAQHRSALAKARFQTASLQNRCDTAERDLASARESLKAKDEAIKANARSPRGRSVDLSSPGRSAGERSMVYIPTAAELEQSAALLTSLQNDVIRLNREKSAIEQEIAKLKESFKAKEEENQVIGGKLRQSAELASELGKQVEPAKSLHLAANSRAEAAEEKLLDIQKEMQELKELMQVQARENKSMQNTTNIASGLTKMAEQSRIAQLESQLAEVSRVRDKAMAQSDIWQENRNSWKRWGELMALRAKQWEDEASKVKTPFPKDILYVQPEEPPLLPPGPLAELGKTRKRPLDMPDTDVDAEAKPHTDNSAPPLSVDSGEQGIERKRARFVS